ncbi:MAG: HNH endonuclease [Candidatus Brocadiales bacterium]
MKIKSDFNKCVLCLKNPANSWEHIIPKCIGGRLQVQVLCKDCNNKLGSTLINKVKTDPSIRLAVWNLKDEIPELFEAIENNQIYIDEVKNCYKYKNSKLKIITHEKEDGSLNYDTTKADKHIERKLRKDGLSEDEIADKTQLFKGLEDNKFIQLSKKVSVEKRSPESLFPSLQDPLLDERVIVLIAYEFLCLLIGNLIYNEELDFIRVFIKEGAKSKKLVVEHLKSDHYSPRHKIYPELLETEIIINIILFGWLVRKVHIKGVRLSSPDYVYLEALKSRKTRIAESVGKAKQGIYMVVMSYNSCKK